jgi:hypothetical protein
MRFRVLAAWMSQIAIAVGLLLTIIAGAATGGTDWSSVAVLVLAFVGSIAAWLRFELGIPLVVADVLFALLGLGLGLVDPGGTGPADLTRRFVGGLWTIGGVVGAIALIASTSRGDDASRDIDSTAY